MKIKAFKALRPNRDIVKDFSTMPYDVVTDEQVINSIKNNKGLFFEVIKTDSLYKDDIYIKAKENLDNFKKDKILIEDEKQSFYIYQEIFKDINQTGLVATINVDEYINGNIKRHEKTLKEKEMDRIKNFYICNANTEPVFLFQKNNDELKNIIDSIKSSNSNKEYDFVTQDGVRHILWKIDDEDIISKIQDIFKSINELYIADGHHRTASAIEVALKLRKEKPAYDKNANFNYFMAVIFFENELKILPYNRVIKDISKYDMKYIFEKIEENFNIKKLDKLTFPQEPYNYTMIIDKNYYNLSAKSHIINENDALDCLDTVILHKNIIEPLFKINDIKNEDDIAFIGGTNIDEKIIQLSKNNIIILMYPTQIEQIKKISLNNQIMPPKSTWFEPKLRSGLFIHEF